MHRKPHPVAVSPPEQRRATLGTDANPNAKESAVLLDHVNEGRTDGGSPRAAHGHAAPYEERMLRIRRRVADGAYDLPAAIGQVARRLLDSGDLD